MNLKPTRQMLPSIATLLFLFLAQAVSLEVQYLLVLPMDVEHELDIKYQASKTVTAELRIPGYNYTQQTRHEGYMRLQGKTYIPKGGIENKAILLSLRPVDDVILGSFDPTVIASGHFSEMYSYLTLPITALGSHYVISTYLPPAWGHSQLVIAAAWPHTQVSITLKTNGQGLGGEYSNGQDIVVNLKQYQTYSMKISNADISGTVIRSTKDVAVYAGNFKLVFPRDSADHGNRNPTFEQFLPVKLLGTTYVVPHIGACKYQELRLVGTEDDTAVALSGQSITLGETSIASQEIKNTLIVRSNKPLLVTTTCQANVGLNTAFLTIVPPVERYKTLYNVPHTKPAFDYGKTSFQDLIIITGGDNTGGIVLDDEELHSGLKWETIGGFAVAIVPVDISHHTVRSSTPFGLLERIYENNFLESSSGTFLGINLEYQHESISSIPVSTPPMNVEVNSDFTWIFITVPVLTLVLIIVVISLLTFMRCRRKWKKEERFTETSSSIQDNISYTPESLCNSSLTLSSGYMSAHTVLPDDNLSIQSYDYPQVKPLETVTSNDESFHT